MNLQTLVTRRYNPWWAVFVTFIVSFAAIWAANSTAQLHDQTVRRGSTVETLALTPAESIIVVHLEGETAEYVKWEADGLEQVGYDGGFLGYWTLGLLGNAGRYQIRDGKTYRMSCEKNMNGGRGCQAVGPAQLPQKYADLLEEGRAYLKKSDSRQLDAKFQ